MGKSKPNHAAAHAAAVSKRAMKGGRAAVKPPKITAKQEGGDDGYCYVVRCNGVEVINGLTRSEVAYYKKQALRMYEENPARYGGPTKSTPAPAVVSADDPRVANIARSAIQHAQDAAGEMGYEHSAHSDYAEPDIQKKIAKAKKEGVRDIGGWMADEYWNDSDFLQDMLGDKIYEECDGDRALQNAVYDHIAKNAHPALKKAMIALKRD